VVVGPGESGPVVVQAVGQWAGNEQAATSSADSTQKGASSANAPVRVKSPGDDGAVKQANPSSATSAAGNANATDQATEQSAVPWSDVLVQAIGQKADSEQGARSDAASEQLAPANENLPVAIVSPGHCAGEVGQSNDSSAASAAGNHDATWQRARERG
jgi:hypothetical protein